MPWIHVVEEDEADGTLKQAYAAVKGKRGKVANILKIHSLLPQTMVGHLDFYTQIMFAPGALNRRQRELVATVVSVANRCDYCIRHHAEALQAYVKDQAFVDQVVEDYTGAALSAAERAMCDYAVKLTQTPHEVDESDVEGLRQAGLNDRAALQLALVTGYFNFVNRVALGLGVSFSEDELRGYTY